jgi:hypothetical protein
LLKNPFGLGIGWQVKITTDDIDDISSVEENIGHSCESGSMHGLWVPVYSSDAIVNRNDPPRRNRCAGSVTRNSSRCATFVAMMQTTHLWFYHGDRGAVTNSSIPKLGGFRCMIDTRMLRERTTIQGAPRDLISQISNSTIRSALGRGDSAWTPGKNIGAEIEGRVQFVFGAIFGSGLF